MEEKEKLHRIPKYERKNNRKRVLTLDQKDAICAAKELCYPKTVINAIINTENAIMVSRILTDARHGIFPKEKEDD